MSDTNYTPAPGRLYTQCPACHREQYAPAVIDFSKGLLCCPRCCHVIREDARLETCSTCGLFLYRNAAEQLVHRDGHTDCYMNEVPC